MIDLLKEIELLEQVCEAAEDGDFEKVTELCRDKIHDNLKAVRDFDSRGMQCKNWHCEGMF